MLNLACDLFSDKPEREEEPHDLGIDFFDRKPGDKSINDEDSDDPEVEYDELIEAVIVIKARPIR